MKIEAVPALKQEKVLFKPNPESPKLAYKIAVALQSKVKNAIVGLRTLRFEGSERYLFEYTLSDEKNEVGTAFSEGYFEGTDKEYVAWLATKIYTDLTQRAKWLRS